MSRWVFFLVFGGYITITVCVIYHCATNRRIAEYYADALIHLAELQAGFRDAVDPTEQGPLEPRAGGYLSIVRPTEEEN